MMKSEDKLKFLNELDVALGNIDEACENSGIDREIFNETLRTDSGFRLNVRATQADNSPGYKKAGWHVANELIIDGLEAELAKDEGDRNYDKISKLTKGAVEMNDGMEKHVPGGDSVRDKIIENERELKIVEKEFYKEFTMKYDPDYHGGIDNDIDDILDGDINESNIDEITSKIFDFESKCTEIYNVFTKNNLKAGEISSEEKRFQKGKDTWQYTVNVAPEFKAELIGKNWKIWNDLGMDSNRKHYIMSQKEYEYTKAVSLKAFLKFKFEERNGVAVAVRFKDGWTA